MGRRTVRDCFGDLRAHFCRKADMCHRAKGCCLIQWIAKLVSVDDIDGLGDEGVEMGFMDIDPFNAATTLPRIEHCAINQGIDCRIDIRIFTYIAWVFAAKL